VADDDMHRRREHASVLAALELTRRPPEGHCPDEEQIAAWTNDALSERRANEVKSHVAHCERCFAIWTELLDGEAPVAESDPPSPGPVRLPWLRGWRGLFGGGALMATLAGVLAVLVVVPALDDRELQSGLDSGFETFAGAYAPGELAHRWPWSAGFATRAGKGVGGEPLERVANAAFRAGIVEGIRQLAVGNEFWEEVLRAAGPQQEPCEPADVPEGCGDVARDMTALGRWSALTYLACESPRDVSSAVPARLGATFWEQQHAVLERLEVRISETLPASAYARLLGQWLEQPESSDDSRQLVCGRISTLMTLGLAD
jgi:hypothetical protein